MTLTCDTVPVTNSPSDPFRKLRDYAARIEQARQRVRDLEEERDEEILRVISRNPRSVTAAARAAGLSRQRVSTIRLLAQARLAGRPNIP
jgi:hypothetical protein